MKTSLTTTIKSLAVLIMFALIITVANAFTAPTTAAPGGNVFAPVNTGPTLQTKPATLGLAGLIAGTTSGTALTKGIEVVQATGDINVRDGFTGPSASSLPWPAFIFGYDYTGKILPLKLNTDQSGWTSTSRTLLPKGVNNGEVLTWVKASTVLGDYTGYWKSVALPPPPAPPAFPATVNANVLVGYNIPSYQTANDIVSVYCPAGQVAVGGGAFCNDSTGKANLRGSYPLGNNGWRGDCDNKTATDADDVTAFVICASQVPAKLITQ